MAEGRKQIAIETQVKCARRELALRRVVIPKRVGDGRMKGGEARHEIETMAAIVETLERCRMLEEVSRELRELGNQEIRKGHYESEIAPK